jgi:hypothetical protein
MRTVALGAFAVMGCLGAGAGVLRAADSPPVTFAVVRGDGILIPFATRTGNRWTNPWPTPGKRVDVPLRFTDVPKAWWGKAEPATIWQAWFVAGGTTRATVDKPTWYMAHCEHGVGLQTGVIGRPPLPPPTVSPYPKLGLATTGAVDVRGIEVLDRRHAIGSALPDVLSERFRASEAREYLALAAQPDGYRPVKSPTGLPGTIRLDALYRMPRPDGQFLYYFELVRRYPEIPDAAPTESAAVGRGPAAGRCQGMSFASGWFLGTATKIPSTIDVQVRLVSCDYGGAAVMQPLGYVTDAGGAFWIGQLSSWDWERYFVLRSNGRRAAPQVVVATRAGTCD